MLLETVIVVAAVVTGMVSGKEAERQIREYGIGGPFVAIFLQSAFSASNAILFWSGMTLLSVSSPSIIVAPFAAIAPPIINTVHTLRKSRQKRKALNGDYGDATRWATELVNEGDREFMIAVNALPQTEITEVGIIADSKQELRERTIARFEEQANDSIPEDFA